MTSLSHMAHILTRRSWPVPPAMHQVNERGTTKTELMRRYLRQHGWANSHTLAIEADVPQVALVGALLKGDLLRGSVIRQGNGYAWNTHYDAQTAVQIQQAKALLRRHGYVITRKVAP